MTEQQVPDHDDELPDDAEAPDTDPDVPEVRTDTVVDEE